MPSFTAANWARKNYPYLIAIGLFIVFKFLFPYPDVFLDSVNYLQWGLSGAKIAFRQLGYSHFLMLFSGYGNNYINVVAVQYLVFVLATKFFLETVFYIFDPGNKIKWLLWILILFNPINLFVNNLISTDGLFISFSAVWLASLLQFFYAPKHKYLYLAVHLVSFIFLFGLRYNALYYPIISALAFLFLKKGDFLPKLIPIALTGVVFFSLYRNTVDNSDKKVGVPILSGFGGWAMANNALHIYRVIDVDSEIWDDPDYKTLHQYCLKYKDSIPGEKTGVTDRFLWDKKGPLKQYLLRDLKLGKYPDYMTGWWNESILYNSFGKSLILRYPGAFFKSFYGPNLGRVFFPPTETLGSYNRFDQRLDPAWQKYFGVQKEQFTARTPALQEHFTKAFDIFCIPVSLLTVFCSLFLVFLYVKTLVTQRPLTPAFATLVILAGFYIISILLLAFVHPVLLRYVLLLHVYFIVVPVFFFVNKFFSGAPVEGKIPAA